MNRLKPPCVGPIICLFIILSSVFAHARTYRYDCFWQYDPVKLTDMNPLAFRFTVKKDAKQYTIAGEVTMFRHQRILTFELVDPDELRITLSGKPGNTLWDTQKIGQTFEFTNDQDTIVTCLCLTVI